MLKTQVSRAEGKFRSKSALLKTKFQEQALQLKGKFCSKSALKTQVEG